LMTRSESKDQFLGATAAVLGGALWSAFGSGVVSELWAVYSGRVALVLFGGSHAVRLLPRRPLVEALTEMAEQLALHRGLRHGVVGAA
jgi:hypothetical protein